MRRQTIPRPSPPTTRRLAATLTFNPGDKTETIVVSVKGDTLDEVNETFFVNLSNEVNATIDVGQGTGTITDDDVTPTVAFTAAAQSKAESAGTATITAQLSALSGKDVTVPFTVTGTATGGGTDYTITASPVTITAGTISSDITVTIIDDAVDELDETVIVTMGAPTNATKGSPTVHTLTITDDDNVAIVSDVNSLDVPENSTATFQVKLGAQPIENVNVAVAKSAGGADISVTGGAALTFTTANWNTYQDGDSCRRRGSRHPPTDPRRSRARPQTR